MRVHADNNLVFDTADERCFAIEQPISHQHKAVFLQCFQHGKTSKAFIRRYCGLIERHIPLEDQPKAIADILMYGDKYDWLVTSIQHRFPTAD